MLLHYISMLIAKAECYWLVSQDSFIVTFKKKIFFLCTYLNKKSYQRFRRPSSFLYIKAVCLTFTRLQSMCIIFLFVITFIFITCIFICLLITRVGKSRLLFVNSRPPAFTSFNRLLSWL